MSENKKYFFLKLKENYFDNPKIILLEKKYGVVYTNILLKLSLLALKNNGELLLDEDTPLDTEMLGTILNFQFEIIEPVIQVLIEKGFIQVLNNQVMYMADMESLVGKSSSEADRKKKSRENNKKINLENLENIKTLENLKNTESGHLSKLCPPEIRVKSLENKTKSLERDGSTSSTSSAPTESKQTKQTKQTKKSANTTNSEVLKASTASTGSAGSTAGSIASTGSASTVDQVQQEYQEYEVYGEYGNVYLREEEIIKLQGGYRDYYREYIERLSRYMESTGKAYKNHYVTICTWLKKDVKSSSISLVAGNENSL